MKGTGWTLAAAAAVGLAVAGAAHAADDDLAVVRKAVTEEHSGGSSAVKAAQAPIHKGGEARWLKVRIEDRREKKSKVSVNLPLALVRAIGNDWPVDGRCHKHEGESHRCPTVGEVLRLLESGQDIVQIEDEGSTVRVWVE